METETKQGIGPCVFTASLFLTFVQDDGPNRPEHLRPGLAPPLEGLFASSRDLQLELVAAD